MIRFQQAFDPLLFINAYLYFVLQEVQVRGYTFNGEKVDWEESRITDCFLEVSSGQLNFKRSHLLSKLLLRDPLHYNMLASLPHPVPHPLFTIVEGAVEAWEKP